MHAVACKTVTVSQSQFATRFANWHFFSLPNKSNLAFSKAFGSENYRFALSGEKHLATAFAPSKFRKKNTVGDFNAL